MRRIFLLLGLVFLLTDCKKDESPASVIETIVGRWQLVGTMTTLDKSWVKPDSASQQYYINVRRDGLILNDAGYINCCAPESLTINGDPFKITQKPNAFYHPMCSLANCVSCPNLVIERTGNELIITHCGGYRQKYAKDQSGLL